MNWVKTSKKKIPTNEKILFVTQYNEVDMGVRHSLVKSFVIGYYLKPYTEYRASEIKYWAPIELPEDLR